MNSIVEEISLDLLPQPLDWVQLLGNRGKEAKRKIRRDLQLARRVSSRPVQEHDDKLRRS